MATANEQAWWQKTTTLMWTTLGIWFFFGFLIHFFAAPMNSIHILGFPLGYWWASQGAITIFVVVCFWFAKAQDKIDREFGVAEED